MAGGVGLLAVIGMLAAAIVTATPRERTSELSLLTQIRNLREVDPGRFYRSAQLEGDQFAEAIERLGIRSIVNLRGKPTTPVEWYEQEIAVSERLGVRHFDVRLSARSVPRRAELLALLKVYEIAERPILVHCQDGADRAGEASAIYAIDEMGFSNDEALELLTPRFLHFRWFRPAKRYFIERYRGRRWARREYDPCDFEYYDVARYCAAKNPEGSVSGL